MSRDSISEVGIDTLGRLYVSPNTAKFPFIYREGLEVHWEDETRHLFTPAPPRSELWPVSRWFQQITLAAKAQDCELFLSTSTRWVNIPDNIRHEIQSNHGAANA